VGLAENGPLGSRFGGDEVQTIGGQRSVRAAFDRVSLGYFDAIGARLVEGRDFTPADRFGGAPVVIINDILARQLFDQESPLGRTIQHRGEEDEASQCEVIGVVKANRYYDLHRDPPPAIFTNTQQDAPYMPTLHVRAAAGSAALVIAEVRREFDAIDKDFPVFNIRTLADRIDDSLAPERLVSQLAGAFGTVALLLAVIGIYGIMAYSVSERRREIGLRMALGAAPASVLGMILKESMLLVLAGIAIGSPAAIAAGRIASSVMPGVERADALILIAAALLMTAAAVLAGVVPARRASRIDPMAALRHE